MMATLAQLLTAAHVLAPYEDDHGDLATVVLETEPHVRGTDNCLCVTLEGIGYRIREDGKLMDAAGRVSGGQS